MFDNIDDSMKGEFNSGLAIIFRLDSIHKFLHNAKASRDHDSYYWWLVSLFTELIRFMNDKEGEIANHKTYWDSVTKDYFRIRDLSQTNKPIPMTLYMSFVSWELELVMVEQKYNIGMPKKMDPRFGMANK